MSLEAMQAMAKYSQAEHPARIVAMGLAYFAERHTHLAWPSDQLLMEWARVSRSQLYRALRTLERSREIARQPRSAGGPRRVFLVDPLGALQLPLFEANVSPVTRSGVEAERVTGENERATHAGASRNRKNLKDNNYPPSPPEGGDAPDLHRILSQPGQTPSPPGAAQGAAAARRRRRRRRDHGSCVASEPCPLQHPTSDATQLGGEWPVLSKRLAEVVGHGQWELWFADAHPHQVHPDLVVLALQPHCASWATRRFQGLIAEATGMPVRFVGCEALGR